MFFDRTPVTFPRLFSSPRPAVPSPLTCRHPKHLRCACHNQPTTTPATDAAPEKQPHTPIPPKAHAEALRRIKRYYLDLLSEIIDVVRHFPDAALAVGEKLRASADIEPDDPDFAYE